jgi:hypothetical protein
MINMEISIAFYIFFGYACSTKIIIGENTYEKNCINYGFGSFGTWCLYKYK